MHFKKKIQKNVYHLYLKGVPVDFIASYIRLGDDDINEIIDYLNEIYQ